MKYRITPFNLIAVLIFCYGIYFLASPNDTLGWGMLFGLTFLGIAWSILTIDYFVQYFNCNYKWIVISQSILVVFITLLNYNDIKGPKTKSFIIPPKISGHINIIYEVKGSPELPFPSSFLSNKQSIIVPVSGIILTSSKVSEAYSSLAFEIENKTKYDSLELTTITFDTIVIRNTIYPLETYTVTKVLFWINTDVGPQEKNLIRKEILNKRPAAN